MTGVEYERRIRELSASLIAEREKSAKLNDALQEACRLLSEYGHSTEVVAFLTKHKVKA